jgi:hypothetical protein
MLFLGGKIGGFVLGTRIHEKCFFFFFFFFLLLQFVFFFIHKLHFIPLVDYIEQEIGRGSFGAVYLVVDDKEEKKALKIFLSGDEKRNQAMEADISIGMNPELDSPYIIRYKEKFEENNLTCVVMDYMENGMDGCVGGEGFVCIGVCSDVLCVYDVLV